MTIKWTMTPRRRERLYFVTTLAGVDRWASYVAKFCTNPQTKTMWTSFQSGEEDAVSFNFNFNVERSKTTTLSRPLSNKATTLLSWGNDCYEYNAVSLLASAISWSLAGFSLKTLKTSFFLQLLSQRLKETWQTWSRSTLLSYYVWIHEEIIVTRKQFSWFWKTFQLCCDLKFAPWSINRQTTGTREHWQLILF